MSREDLEKIREWIREEIELAIEQSQPGSDGYFGYGSKEPADRLFEEVCVILNKGK